MRYFDPLKELTIIVDASPVGLGGILTQDNYVLSYACRSLTEVESRFDMYTIITDHKPLGNIWKKTSLPYTKNTTVGFTITTLQVHHFLPTKQFQLK